MKTTVNNYDFHRAFEEMNRTANFSYDGLNALFEYLEQYEEDTGEEVELDVIAICCDFTEYANLAEFQADYGDEYETLEDIEDATALVRVDTSENDDGVEDGSFIIRGF